MARILYFIGGLRAGGKERRLIELLTYLQGIKTYELMVVLKHDIIEYSLFYRLRIPYIILNKIWSKNDPSLFYRLFKICKLYKPDIIHTWGDTMTTYAIPVSIMKGIPIVNNQITSAPPRMAKWTASNLLNRINFHFSSKIVSNSMAGMESYKPNAGKGCVIYNGVNLNRFKNMPSVQDIKAKYKIYTPYNVIMSASYSNKKNYGLFVKIAEYMIKKRDDISFIGVGREEDEESKNIINSRVSSPRILFPGRVNDIEALVNACDIGLLLTNQNICGEGISNSIIEYMALGKPVIATDTGGTGEIIEHGMNGYLVINESVERIADMINDLTDNSDKRKNMGDAGRRKVEESFTIDRMGKEFENVYAQVLNGGFHRSSRRNS